MTTHNVALVPPDHIHAAWPQVESYIERSVAHSNGDVEVLEIKTNLLNGKWLLYVAITDDKVVGASVVDFANRINDRVVLIVAIGGRLVVNPEMFASFCSALRAQGGTTIEGAVRPSLARLYHRIGFTDKAIISQFRL